MLSTTVNLLEIHSGGADDEQISGLLIFKQAETMVIQRKLLQLFQEGNRRINRTLLSILGVLLARTTRQGQQRQGKETCSC